MVGSKISHIILVLPLLVIMYNFKCVKAEAEGLTAQNLRKTPIYVCTNATASSGPIKLDANKYKPLPAAQGSSLILWGKLDSSDCIIDTQNPTAKTVAEFYLGSDVVIYGVSVEIGYNFGIRIRPLQGANGCDTISCVGDLSTSSCQTPDGSPISSTCSAASVQLLVSFLLPSQRCVM